MNAKTTTETRDGRVIEIESHDISNGSGGWLHYPRQTYLALDGRVHNVVTDRRTRQR